MEKQVDHSVTGLRFSGCELPYISVLHCT